MGRPPLPVGTFGKIHFEVLGRHRVQAGASFRDLDGRRRYVIRLGPSRAQAERRLREALRDRSTASSPPVAADSRLSTLAARLLADVDGSELALAPYASPSPAPSGRALRRAGRRSLG